MAEQHADTEQLKALVETLTSLVDYCDALRTGAGSFAYMLPSDWQGPASTRFMAMFETWAAGANAMKETADSLRQQADAAYKAYDGTIESLDTTWQKIRTEMES
ncbi:WXG100 family type VII secretion target [Microbacterium phosphatis]|uniref:WXG100 family type VII secretion target n=1 Tax=Microbacterium phosphatis TaxID=3140248 RepID=UPI0031409EBD